ncbi:MAG: hypothetical protein U1E81_07970 [Xanthobacteraceae bacterium]
MTLRDNQPQTNFLRPKSNAAIINMPRRHLAILIVAKLSSKLSRYTGPRIFTFPLVNRGAVKRYLTMVNDLATSLPHRTIAGDEAISIALRELVSCVTVTPTKKAPPKISVTGRLAALVGGELFPHSRGYHHVGFPRKLRTCSMWPEILTLIHRCDTGRPTRR